MCCLKTMIELINHFVLLTIFYSIIPTYGQNFLLPVIKNISYLSDLDNYYWYDGSNSSKKPLQILNDNINGANGIFFDAPEQQFFDLETEDASGIYYDDIGETDNDIDDLTDSELQVFDEETEKKYTCPQCRCGVRFRNRIVGGTYARRVEFPWLGILRQTGYGFICGGSVINDLYFVTAAHCVVNYRAREFSVRLLDLVRDRKNESPAFNVGVRKIIVNRSYNPNTDNNDIALLKFRKRLPFQSYVRPICLPQRERSFARHKAVIAGWGTTKEGGQTTQRLKRATVNIFTNRLCRRTSVRRQVSPQMICAGKLSGGVDACQGDSGGPLMVLQNKRYVLAGLTSWGLGCAQRNSPGVYTRVSRQLPWIYRNTRDACYC